MDADRTSNTTTYNMQFKNKSGIGGRFVIGFLLVAFGAGLLLNSFGVYEFSDFFGTWWPSVLMIVALAQFATGKGQWFWSSILFLAGALLQARNLDMLPGGFWSAFWPCVLILAGISVLVNRGNKKKVHPAAGSDTYFGGTSQSYAGDRVDRTAIFSGQELRMSSKNFTGGELTAIFGGIEIDLRDAEIQEPTVMLSVEAIFGGVEIRVPPNWQIALQGTPIFGGIEDKTMHMPNVTVAGPMLIIDATAIFGGIEIGY